MNSELNQEAKENQTQHEEGKNETPKPTISSLNSGKKDFLSMRNGKEIMEINASILFKKNGKIKLKRLQEAFKGKKINLLEVDLLNLAGKINISNLVNDFDDDKIDLFSYSTNIDNGKIDLKKLTNGKNGKIDVFLLNGITNEKGQLNFEKVFTSSIPLKFNYNIINLDNYFCSGKLMLSKIKILNADSNIDLFDFKQCLTNGKIDQTKLCNSDSDDSIDIFNYTVNHSNNKIKLDKFTNIKEGTLDLFKFNGLTDCNGQVDFTRIDYSRGPKKIIYSLINIDKFFHNGKLILSKIKVSGEKGRINLFDFPPCLSKGKIDQAKICNSESDKSIDIFKYTVNHVDGKIDISNFTHSKSGEISLSKFTGIKDKEGKINQAKIFDSSNTNQTPHDILF